MMIQLKTKLISFIVFILSLGGFIFQVKFLSLTTSTANQVTYRYAAAVLGVVPTKEILSNDTNHDDDDRTKNDADVDTLNYNDDDDSTKLNNDSTTSKVTHAQAPQKIQQEKPSKQKQKTERQSIPHLNDTAKEILSKIEFTSKVTHAQAPQKIQQEKPSKQKQKTERQSIPHLNDAAKEILSKIETNLTRSEYIKKFNILHVESKKRIFSHFLLHIPKGGGTFVHRTMNSLIKVLPEFIAMDPKHKYTQCDVATQEKFSLFTEYPNTKDTNRCNLWMSESPKEDQAMHQYVVIRPPQTHVLSQYFHCKESKPHQRLAHRMPTLDFWLDYYLQIKKSDDPFSAGYKKGEFSCKYYPENMQSQYVKFSKSTTVEDLMNQFDIIGDFQKLSKTVCAITIRYTGFIPEVCDCTNKVDEHRRLAFSHGVTHHGDTFNLTDSQALKIQNLTSLDRLLYERAQIAFDRQVKEIEDELNIVLCESPDLESSIVAMTKELRNREKMEKRKSLIESPDVESSIVAMTKELRNREKMEKRKALIEKVKHNELEEDEE